MRQQTDASLAGSTPIDNPQHRGWRLFYYHDPRLRSSSLKALPTPFCRVGTPLRPSVPLLIARRTPAPQTVVPPYLLALTAECADHLRSTKTLLRLVCFFPPPFDRVPLLAQARSVTRHELRQFVSQPDFAAFRFATMRLPVKRQKVRSVPRLKCPWPV